MVEFNLLPDVKMQYLRTKRLEHLIITISVVVAALALATFVILVILTELAQKVTINDLNTQITNSTAKLSSDKNLNQILTVQNQLETIPKLQSESPKTSRLFSFLSQLSPVSATISTLNISYVSNDVTITGGADSLNTVNTFVDTLKYATYDNSTTNTKNIPAFNNVILSSFNYSNNSSSSTASLAQYSITFDFDPVLFDSSDNINLVVPSEITTRSIINQPALFKAEPTPATTGQGE